MTCQSTRLPPYAVGTKPFGPTIKKSIIDTESKAWESFCSTNSNNFGFTLKTAFGKLNSPTNLHQISIGDPATLFQRKINLLLEFHFPSGASPIPLVLNNCSPPSCLSPSEGDVVFRKLREVFSNVRLEKLNTAVKKDTSAIGNYILVDFNQVNNLLRSAKCQYCEKQTLKLELGAKLGFSYNLKLLCSNCDENKTVVNTSLKSVPTGHDVNLRIIQAFSHIGKGYSAIEKFCTVMNIDPFSSTTYGKCARRLDNAYTLASENIFAEIHREIKNAYENGAEIADLRVSFDGTWLTRGHISLIGVGCVIDMLTGYVVDFEVMSKVCRHCYVAKNKLGQSSAEFSIWYEGHKSECDINHLGSSTSMEMEAALTLCKRSTSLGFRYITVLSDGDCKTFNYLCGKKVYGPDIVIKKEECINHVSKRLGTALRFTVKYCRAQGISLGGKAHGSLKEVTIKKITTYYQKAILRNKGDVNAMKTAIYATLLHSISTDAKPQHSKCPAGENSWCFYQSAIANGEKPNNHKLNVGTAINEKFLPKILPIY
ncbi:uncharacterized protein TNCV_4579061 [Trichonephila clavipes]|nr:uncharacterized protein TNCV_4579061 [Trichonephila clavipes]